jgi:hypothetical protein
VRLREELQCDLAIGIGSAAVDAEFLLRADVAILIPDSRGEVDRELAAAMPDARVAADPGPLGWVRAIEAVWGSIATTGPEVTSASESA